MEGSDPNSTALGFVLRLGVTLFFVGANGFFVAAEFALVKVRAGQLSDLADDGDPRARLAQHIHANLGRYLSACQLGITLASLILGWLAEPAVAALLLAALAWLDAGVDPSSPLVHGVSLGIALSVVTILHMTIGEQAPKIWSIHRALPTSLRVARPLQAFATLFRPFIWVVDGISNWLLRLAGLSPDQLDEHSHNVGELRSILAASSEAGHISPRQLELAQNVFGMIGLEVRHIMVPRVDVDSLSLQNEGEENVKVLRRSGHSRLPLCRVGLDTVIGIVHAKDVLRVLLDGGTPDIERLARPAMFTSDTQPLSGLIIRMQRGRNHCAVVLDEHGTAVGLAFLEDAIEEIVGPIRDEFDDESPGIRTLPGGAIELPGSMALPEAVDVLELDEPEEEADTIGGHVVALLGRLPRRGDELRIGRYRVTVVDVTQHRVGLLRFEPRDAPSAPPAG
jgi:CBS domain containing-hemolysin-like protein